MKAARFFLATIIAAVCLNVRCAEAGQSRLVYPGRTWPVKRPSDAGLDVQKLKEMSDYAGGFGCVVRGGYMVYTWGDPGGRMDVASAVKPVYAHFLLKAVESGKLKGFDELVSNFEPRLKSLNESLGYKDREITWRHLCNQV